MTESEAVELLFQLAGVYCSGFFAGFTITAIKQFFEKV